MGLFDKIKTKMGAGQEPSPGDTQRSAVGSSSEDRTFSEWMAETGRGLLDEMQKLAPAQAPHG